MNTYQHWHLTIDEEKFAWLTFDKKDVLVNTLDQEVMREFSLLLDEVANNRELKGLVLHSAKKSGFAAGADISQFKLFKDINESTNVLIAGQAMIAKLAALSIPTVAAIEGLCLGGGLEMTLGCHYRIGVEDARLGLPETKLGIIPGWGGTVRTLRLTGAIAGLGLILTGRLLSARSALKIGLIDALVPKRQLMSAVRFYLRERPQKRKLSFTASIQNFKIVRQIIAHFLRKKLSAKVDPSHYPAPFQAVANWEKMGVETDEAFKVEANTCGRLFFSDTSHNLVKIFYLQEQLKGLGKGIDFKINHIHVAGAGIMGGDIAAWCALRGFTVTLADLDVGRIASAIKRAKILFTEKLKEKHLITKAMDRLIPDRSGNGVIKADLIIEAVVEDLAVKQTVLKLIESRAKPDAILATNTSSIPLDDINTALLHPERLVGIHYFNPVAKMPLVEIVKGERTSALVIDKATSFVRQIDRLPLPVKSSPGFLVNRILLPYMMESMRLLNEGYTMADIDQAMLNFGMPMGPITLADTVGLDVCLSVATYLGKYYNLGVPESLKQLVTQGKLGKKTGTGFYNYNRQGKKVKSEKSASSEHSLIEIANRLVGCLIKEAELCLQEGVVANAELLDAGMVFATGFAPFRGGLINYAKTEGLIDYKGV